jgi:cell division protein YceG involved in septum cleavage
MDTIDSLVQIVARYTDAQLVEAREMMARWDAEADMPASLVTLARIIEEEAAYRKAEDLALQEGGR